MVARDRAQSLALGPGQGVPHDLDEQQRSEAPEQVVKSNPDIYKPVKPRPRGLAVRGPVRTSKVPVAIQHQIMCMTMGVSRPQPASFVPRNLQGDWGRAIFPGHLLRRGAVVPMQVASHQLPIGYHPVSRRIIGNQAGDLYCARRALTAEDLPDQ